MLHEACRFWKHREVGGLCSPVQHGSCSTPDDELRKKICEWLSPPDPSTNHNAALQARHEGTGDWFLEGQEFLKWTTTPGSFLWIHGIRMYTLIVPNVATDVGAVYPAGNGKTILWYVSARCRHVTTPNGFV